jgi:hypothetical protein
VQIGYTTIFSVVVRCELLLVKFMSLPVVNYSRLLADTSSINRGTFTYSLSAVLILLWAILENPRSAEAQDNACRIALFIRFLRTVVDDGCDVQRLLDFCISIGEVASCALGTSQALEQEQSRQVALGRGITLAQVEVSGITRAIQNRVDL